MKKKFSKSVLMTALITGLCVGGVQSAFAAENLQEFTLDPMIVTATRTEKNLLKVPASASVITAKEMEEKNIQNVEDALRNQVGILSSNVEDAYGSVQVRGFDSSNVLILYDGQPMNNCWNGGANLNAIPVDNIERIEVVRGAASSLYGGRAVGGVINIITKDIGTKKFGGNLTLNYGSHDTWRKAINVQGKINDKWSFGVGYEQRETDGYYGFKTAVKPKTTPSNNNVQDVNLEKLSDKKDWETYKGRYIVGSRGKRQYEHENYDISVKYNFDEDRSLKYTYTRSNYEYRYREPISYIKDANGKPLFSGSFKTQYGEYVNLSESDFFTDDCERESDIHTLNYVDKKNLWNVNFGLHDMEEYSYGADKVENMQRYGTGELTSTPQKNYNLDIQKTWENIGKHTITAGVNWKTEKYDRDVYNVAKWNDVNSITGHEGTYHGGKTDLKSIFIQDEYGFNDEWTMYVGGRLDQYKKYDGYSNHTGRTVPEETFTEFSPKVAFEYAPSDTLSYYVSYGHSFNTPILYQMFRGYKSSETKEYLANPDLKPETTDTFEIGVKKKFDNTLLTVSVFKAETDDIVTSKEVDKKGDVHFWQYVNLNKGERQGIEFSVQHEFNEKLGAYLNYTWQDGELTDDDGTDNNYDIPKHMLHVGLDYNIGKFNAVLDGQYVSRRQSPGATTGEFQACDPYFTMNTYLNYKVAPNATLQFGIENLLDREYYDGNLADGRTYNVSLRYSF